MAPFRKRYNNMYDFRKTKRRRLISSIIVIILVVAMLVTFALAAIV